MSISSPERPEIEIEIEFEDYDDVLHRVFYKIEIEAGVVPPGQTTQCQCGIGLGGSGFAAPASFDVYGAFVGFRGEESDDDFDLDAFDNFTDNSSVTTGLTNLPGFNIGATAHGFSMDVEPFNLPTAGVGDQFVLAFLIGFAPEDFDQVNGNQIQFAAGSTDPGHALSIFQGYQQSLNLPPFQLTECDFNLDGSCDTGDLDALLALGPINNGIERVDSTEIYDLNGDDFIDTQDVDEWLEIASEFNGFDEPYQYGDADLSGFVDANDLNLVGLHWQLNSKSWSDGNFNGDSAVNSEDLNAVAINWQQGIAPATTVPEPNQAALVLCLILLSTVVRRSLPPQRTF